MKVLLTVLGLMSYVLWQFAFSSKGSGRSFAGSNRAVHIWRK